MSRAGTSASALRRIMQQQLATGRALLALAEVSEQAIVAGDALKLETVAPQQRILLDRQVALETTRRQITAELSQALGMERAPTLTLLLPALPSAEASALELLRRQIVATERKMDTQNRRNGCLLENALEFVRFSMEALTSAALKPARYGVNLAQLSAPSFYIDSRA